MTHPPRPPLRLELGVGLAVRLGVGVGCGQVREVEDALRVGGARCRQGQVEAVAPLVAALASTRTADGLDAETMSHDLEGLLGDGPATLLAIDAGVPAAFLLGMRRPDLLTRLVLVEATLGSLPGAEAFSAGGLPWWFGFHAVPGLAERVLAGHEDEYVGRFYDQGTRDRDVRPDALVALLRA